MLGDVTGDGRLDIVAATASGGTTPNRGGVLVMVGDGHGRFRLSPSSPYSVFVGGAVTGKALLVSGGGFDDGAKILLNGEAQKTANDEQNPATMLVARKAAKRIELGQTVTLQVRNTDGSLSNEFRFTRPVN